MTTHQIRRPLGYLLSLLGAATAGAFGIALYTTNRMNGPKRDAWLDEFSISPWELQVPYEPVGFETDEGLTIRGWWFPRPETRRVIIGCAGHRRTKHELIGIGASLWRAGNNILLFDFRGVGESDVGPQSVGHNELPDALAAVRCAQSRLPGAQVGMIGYSMGAAVAILTAARDPAVRAVVADSSYATLRDVIAFAYRQRRLPPLLLALTGLVNHWRYGYTWSSMQPVDAVEKIAPRPLLIIHGSDDGLTPVEQAYRLYQAAREPKELWIVQGARHCGAYFADRQEYVRRVADFFARALES